MPLKEQEEEKDTKQSEIPTDRPIAFQDDMSKYAAQVQDRPELEENIKTQVADIFTKMLSGGNTATLSQFVQQAPVEFDVDGLEEEVKKHDETELTSKDLPELMKLLANINLAQMFSIFSEDGLNLDKMAPLIDGLDKEEDDDEQEN